MIKQLDKALDELSDHNLASDKPSKEEVINIVRILLQLWLTWLRFRVKTVTSETKRVKIKRAIHLIETGQLITTLIK